MNEATSLLPRASSSSATGNGSKGHERNNSSLQVLTGLGVVALLLATLMTTKAPQIARDNPRPVDHDDFVWTVPLLGHVHHHHHKKKSSHHSDPVKIIPSPTATVWHPPEPQRRCPWVAETFRQRDAGESYPDLQAKYAAQSVDLNVFYRATAHIFWKDFVLQGWGDGLKLVEFGQRTRPATIKGVVLDDQSLWTWVTGDQHLSNFGAWRNRNGKVVFSVSNYSLVALEIPIIPRHYRVCLSSHPTPMYFGFRLTILTKPPFTIFKLISFGLPFPFSVTVIPTDSRPRSAIGSCRNLPIPT